jgi:hypothetical protein
MHRLALVLTIALIVKAGIVITQCRASRSVRDAKGNLQAEIVPIRFNRRGRSSIE